MMFLDETAYLWCDCSAVPSHQQHLANGPATNAASAFEIVLDVGQGVFLPA